MKKNWKTTVMGIVAGSAIALSTGNCTGLISMLPQNTTDKIGAIAGASVAILGVLAKDSDSDKKEGE